MGGAAAVGRSLWKTVAVADLRRPQLKDTSLFVAVCYRLSPLGDNRLDCFDERNWLLNRPIMRSKGEVDDAVATGIHLLFDSRMTVQLLTRVPELYIAQRNGVWYKRVSAQKTARGDRPTINCRRIACGDVTLRALAA